MGFMCLHLGSSFIDIEFVACQLSQKCGISCGTGVKICESVGIDNDRQKYKKNMKDDLVAIWKVWVPAQFINFAFCPLWLRVPYVACLSCFWTAFVSFTRGKKEIL